MDPLNAVEARVLGSLIEKDITTPDYYPLTLNALTNACSQSSNRDPVVAYGEDTVTRGLDLPREKKLAFMFQGADSRVPKYGHRVAESLELARPETAVLCVLLLRGPQTLGEIRGRTARMHEFASLEETEASLGVLIARTPGPLAVRLPRQAGMKEQRFAHLLSGEVRAPAAVAEADPGPAAQAALPGEERLARLELESSALRAEVAELRRQLDALKKQLE
jgi:uncharacterized protein YceH (UPF0502 family)